MKTFLSIVLLLVAVSMFADPKPRDGYAWQELVAEQRHLWAVGWMDGATDAGTLQLTPGLNSMEITQGMNQLYAADYRNLSIWMVHAAGFVVRFAHQPMSKAEAEAQLEILRRIAAEDAKSREAH